MRLGIIQWRPSYLPSLQFLDRLHDASADHRTILLVRQRCEGGEFRRDWQLLKRCTTPIDNLCNIELFVEEHIATVQIEMTEGEETPDSVFEDHMRETRLRYPGRRQPVWVVWVQGHGLPILALSLVREVFERRPQRPRRVVPGHGFDLGSSAKVQRVQ
jgi:hypothetical protein